MKFTIAVIAFAAIADTIKCDKLITPQVDHKGNQSNKSLSFNDDVELSNDTREALGSLGIGLIVLGVIAGIVIAVVCLWLIKRRRVDEQDGGHELAEPAGPQKVSETETIDWEAFLQDAGIEEEKFALYKTEFELNIKKEEYKDIDEEMLNQLEIRIPSEDMRKIIQNAKKEDVAKYI